MRWLFLFVLILNVAYVVWELNSATESGYAPKKTTNVPPILLLSELGQDDRPAEPLATGSTESSTDQQTASESQSQTQTGSSDIAEQVIDAPVVAEYARKGEACFTLGPFRKLDKLRAYTRAIKDYVVEASFRSWDEREQSMFWVYLPPSSSYSNAKALGKRLETMNIKDYYVINKGDQKNGVSLGHFKGKDRAYAYSGKLQKLGFTPTIEPVFRTYTIYWLDYRVKSGEIIPSTIYDEHLSSHVKRLDRSCF